MAAQNTPVFEMKSPMEEMVLEVRARCGVGRSDRDFVILRQEDNGDIHITVVENGIPNDAVLTRETFDALISRIYTGGETVQ